MGSCFQVRSPQVAIQKPAKALAHKQPLEENAACGQIAAIANKMSGGPKPQTHSP